MCVCAQFYCFNSTTAKILTQHLASEKLLPYLCIDVLVFKDVALGVTDALNEALDLKGVDPVTGDRTAYTIYENAPQFFDKVKTIANMQTLIAAATPLSKRFKTQKCGAGGYTKVLCLLALLVQKYKY